jgi:hypothetical protein
MPSSYTLPREPVWVDDAPVLIFDQSDAADGEYAQHSTAQGPIARSRKLLAIARRAARSKIYPPPLASMHIRSTATCRLHTCLSRAPPNPSLALRALRSFPSLPVPPSLPPSMYLRPSTLPHSLPLSPAAPPSVREVAAANGTAHADVAVGKRGTNAHRISIVADLLPVFAALHVRPRGAAEHPPDPSCACARPRA